MAANHGRRGSGRVNVPRMSMRAPMDTEDPLSATHSLTASPARTGSSSPAVPIVGSNVDSGFGTSHAQKSEVQDLSFLLDASIYHPLSNLDIPQPYRRALPHHPHPDAPLEEVLIELDNLLKQCHFLSAAHLAGALLTSGHVKSTDHNTIFKLLSIRFSALELSGNVLLAAQESKALEDLSDPFYYADTNASETTDGAGLRHSSAITAKHIMPFDLRLQALRLQGIGFGDPRRAVGALFNLALECRISIARGVPQEISVWQERLEEVSIRVVNALIDIGEVDCALTTMRSIISAVNAGNALWASRLALLLIRCGQVKEASYVLQNSTFASLDQAMLCAIIEIAEGNFEASSKLLTGAMTHSKDPAILAILKQNLAVTLLYMGHFERARQTLEGLVTEGYSFQALTINLATLYDLSSDKSQQLKEDVVNRLSNSLQDRPRREFVYADFKL